MPAYNYNAKTEAGTAISGSLVAGNADQLEKLLAQRGLLLIDYKEQSRGTNFLEGFFSGANDTLLFTVQMATGLPSGLPLIDVLDDMLEEMEQNHFKRVVQDIKINVESGNSLSDALGLYPNYFNEIYRAIVNTGEQSGQLDVIFKDLVSLLEWDRDLKKQVKAAVRYPLGMLTMLTGLIVLVLTVVIPNFSDLFAMGGKQLPGPTRFLLWLGDFMSNYWYLLLGLIVGMISAYKYIGSTSQGKLAIDRMKLKLPIMGPLNQKIAMSRFAHFWKLLFMSGVDLAKTLEIVSEVVLNKSLETSILEARQAIINGQPMSEAFKQTQTFPSLVLRMINLGEVTGMMESSLSKISEYYDKEIPEAIDNALAAFKPIMMLIMAGVLIVVAMAIMLPMFGMIEAVV
ncbi:MAG: type II secretion system F family protein [SAR324 cluster bacterium]|nr:type II secretion system F family protein [SAR324 cluster bacterium]